MEAAGRGGDRVAPSGEAPGPHEGLTASAWLAVGRDQRQEYGAMLLLPLYYQEVRGASALTAGLMLVPQGIGTLLSRGLAGRLTDRIGARPIAVVGFVIVAAATIPFAFAGSHTNAWLLALWLVIRGLGLGAVTISVMTVSFLGLGKEQMGAPLAAPAGEQPRHASPGTTTPARVTRPHPARREG